MADPTTPRDAHEILDALLAPGETDLAALAMLRPAVREHTREAYDALYREPQVLPAPVLHALAAVTADWQGSGVLGDWHRAQGADPALAAADAPEEPALAALRDHVDLLSVSPALVRAEDQRRLAEAGHEATTVVLISQLVAFESHLQRLVAGLAVLHGLETAAGAEPPAREPRTRGRRVEHGGLTVTGRTRPSAFTRETLQWEPWIDVPAEGELTEEQRDSFASKASTNSVYFRMLSLTPGITRARSALDNAIFLPRDGLPKAERELAAAATSKVNDCIYCASVHARKAAGLSKRETEVDALLAAELGRDGDWTAADLAPLAAEQDARWAAIVTAAAELSRPRPALRAEHVTALREHGLEEAEIADALSAAAFFAWANRLMLSLGEPSHPDA